MLFNRNPDREPISAAGQTARTSFAAVLGVVIARLIIAANPELEGTEESVVAATVIALTTVGNIARNLGSRLGSLF
jgi:hypothetical protein